MRGVSALLLALLSGCAGERFVSREFYEPTVETRTVREDGLVTGALKSETTGRADCGGSFSFSILSLGR